MVDFNNEIENKILANIPDLDGNVDTTMSSNVTDDKVTTSTDDKGGTGNEDTSTKQVQTEDKAKAEADKKTTVNDKTSTSTTDDGTKSGESESPYKGSNYSSKDRDLIDPATGKVIARAGTERRLYEREALLSYHSTKGQLEKVVAENKVMQEALVSTRTYGLTAEEVITGQKMIAGWKKDPAATLKYLLTEAHKKGINIEGVGTEASNAVIAELRGQNTNKASTETTKLDDAAVHDLVTNELRTFFINYPEAELHQDLIASVIDKDIANARQAGRASTITTEQAWHILANEAIRRGLDINKPLAPQLNVANKNGGANGANNASGNNATGSQQQSNKPLPNGKGDTGNNLVSTSDVKFADEDMSFKDIIAGALNDVKQANGGNINL
jgi:hypothetical protein